MKVAYLGKIQLSDTDLPFLHEAQQMADVTYFIEITPRFLQGPAFNIQHIYNKSGLFKATDIYPEFNKLDGFIDLNKCYVLNTCGRMWLLKSFWTNFLLMLFLIRNKFNVIHLTWPPNIYEFILYVLRKRMLLTVHDPIPHTGFNTFIVRIRRTFAFRLIPYFILFNKAQRQEFTDLYHFNEQRVIDEKMSCCTYLKTVEPETENIPQEGSFILFAGRISTYKGLDYLLPAMKQIHEQHPSCKLIVAGKGKYHFDISPYQQLDYIDIRNRFIPDNELVALIRNCAFMVCPYTNATQSGVIMSAYAFNKPVVATNVGGLPEMVRHEHYGLIVKEQDVDALVEALSTLWENQEKVEEFSKEIEQDYQTGMLSWRKTAEDIISIYNSRYSNKG
ncbi:MAG: glycosyltransferase family 4 protein [Prevotella sp.]|nr:glycosyltransferase family 4 protein [Prevotella sp.]